MNIIILICAGLFLIFLFSYNYVKSYKTRMEAQENEYNMKYLWIEHRIRHDKHSLTNYRSIERALCCLGHLPYKNKEKTNVLSIEFWDKWTVERLELHERDEFSPEEIFRKN